MTIDGNGNVGVGTVSPASKLSVFSSSTPAVYVGYDGTTANSSVAMGKTPLLQLVADGSGANNNPNIGLLQLNIGGANVYQSASELYIGATRGTTASTRVAVSNGDILGRVGFFGDDATDVRTRGALIDRLSTPQIQQVATGVMPCAAEHCHYQSGADYFYTNTGSAHGGTGPQTTNERMRIDSNGNVGMGTTDHW